MTEAQKSLHEFSTVMMSDKMYPNIGEAASAMSGFIAWVMYVIAIIGMLALLGVLWKTAVDILYLSTRNIGFMATATAKLGANQQMGHQTIKDYAVNEALNLILSLAFIALLISGQALPLAVTVAEATGVIIDKIVGIDVAKRLDESIQLDELLAAPGNVTPAEKAMMQKAYNERVKYNESMTSRVINEGYIPTEQEREVMKRYQDDIAKLEQSGLIEKSSAPSSSKPAEQVTPGTGDAQKQAEKPAATQ